jgi:ABC-type transport system involved in cytochrome bd biosynthesis fused ATPase/permease subunit
LDSETEKDVMSSIEELNNSLTILIVAHRTTTLEKCDKVIQLGPAGNIIFNGTYDQMYANQKNSIS